MNENIQERTSQCFGDYFSALNSVVDKNARAIAELSKFIIDFNQLESAAINCCEDMKQNSSGDITINFLHS